MLHYRFAHAASGLLAKNIFAYQLVGLEIYITFTVVRASVHNIRKELWAMYATEKVPYLCLYSKTLNDGMFSIYTNQQCARTCNN